MPSQVITVPPITITVPIAGVPPGVPPPAEVPPGEGLLGGIDPMLLLLLLLAVATGRKK